MSWEKVIAVMIVIFICFPLLAYMIGRMAGQGWYKSKYQSVTKFIKGGLYGRAKKK